MTGRVVMRNRLKKTISATIIFMILVLMISGCMQNSASSNNEPQRAVTYKDIPGVTEQEIADIEELREHTTTLIYGMMLSTEAFLDQNGVIRGFAPLLCAWLTELFGIPFQPRIYDWPELWAGLETGEISFTGELTRTEERSGVFHMTSPIVSRPFSFIRIPGSKSLHEIAETRPVNFVVFDGATTENLITPVIDYNFNVIHADSFNAVYEALLSGKADAFITENTTIAAFDIYGDVISEDLSPLSYTSVSLTTKNPALMSVISVVEKMLATDAERHHLAELYSVGYHEYQQLELYSLFTDEERRFLHENYYIPTVAQNDNYPLSFYNSRENQWQGIAFDVLREVEVLTGLKFECVHESDASFIDLVKMLKTGEASLMTSLMYTDRRAESYLFSDTRLLAARSSLISKPEFRDVTLNSIMHMKIGLIEGYAHTDFFRAWFPDHTGGIMYLNILDAYDALDRGEIDAVMTGDSGLMTLTHYMERPGYKICYLFDNPYYSTFSLNKDEEILLSILDKTLRFIDTHAITEQWVRKTYDYRSSIAEARMPWIIGAGALSLCVLALVAILLRRSQRSEKRLEVLVGERTHELEMKTSLLLAILDSSPDYIYCKDLSSRYTQCNLITEEFFGLEEGDILGKTDADIFPHSMAEDFANDDKQVIREKQPGVFEKLIMPPSGKGNAIYIETIKAPLVINGEVFGVLGISRNITKRKEMEHSLEKALGDAKAANQSKSSFLANMSHEIRTPMNAIMGITDILLQSESLPDEVTEGLDKIFASSDMLLGIINDILDFSKIEAGKLDILPAEYSAASLINDSANLNMMKIGEKPIVFELDISETIPAKLIGDEIRIKQILNNLLSNAFKYTNAGKVKLSVKSELPVPDEAPNSDAMLILRVQDTGQGMTEKQLSHLFEEYSRFNEETNRTIEGTGLGLSITLRLINLMNGTIKVESEPGEGTSVTIYLPQGLVGNDTLGKEVVENLQNFNQSITEYRRSRKLVRNPMPYGRVLIVDDTETNLYVAVRLLKPYKLWIDTATNGREAIEKVKNGKEYDVIFMDHMMPEMDGIEATKHLRDIGYDKTIVALTANAVAGQADVFMQNGFDAFISKPIDIRQLDMVLNKFIRDKQPLEILEATRNQTENVDAGDSGSPFGDWDVHEQIESLLLEAFIRDARKTIPILEKFIREYGPENDEELQKVIINVHGIKSSLANINETVLSEAAYRLELAGRDGKINTIIDEAPSFLKELSALVKKLKPDKDEGIDHGVTEDEDTEEMLGMMLVIKELCEDYDRKGVIDVISGIKKSSAKTKSVLESIKEQVLHSEFDEAGNIASLHAASYLAS